MPHNSISPAQSRPLSRLPLLLCLLMMASACVPESATFRPSGGSSVSAQIERDIKAGRYDRAARGYERLADSATGSQQKDAYLLDASRAWFNHGESVKGLGTLRRVQGALPANDPIIGMLLATDKLINGQARTALNDLNRLDASIEEPQRPAFLELKARAQAMTGDAAGMVTTLTERETWLRRGDDITNNRRLIWFALRDLGRKGHPLETPEGADRNLQGWMELARLYRVNGRNRVALNQQLNFWRDDFGKHMATDLTANLSEGQNYLPQSAPASVALLLPLSGRLGAPATAIRDGFIAAYLNDADNAERPEVRIYDTSSTSAVEAYETAMANGADFVVGPLSKSNVQALADSNAIATTTLALNYLNDSAGGPVNFYQFSLSPEHESAAIARYALSEGMTRGIALIPETGLGQRLLASFSAAFEAGGGKMIDAGAYDPAEKDFGMPITNLLNLNSSKTRHQQLSAIVGQTLEFEPRRRQDAQFIFLAAGAQQGRLIRPQLNYHYANDLPVLSTASIFEDDASLNRKDLEGVIFAGTPWTVSPDPVIVNQRETLSRAWPQRVKRGGHLYAMGMDAYALLPELHGQRQVLAEGINGLTGRLTLSPGNRIVRDLDIATVTNGGAQYIPPVIETDFLPEPIEGGN